MQVGCVIVDWSEVAARDNAGTLEDDIAEALDAEEEWIKDPPSWTNDSAMCYMSASYICDALRNHIVPQWEAAFDRSLGMLFCAAERPINDSDAHLEEWFFALNPERVEALRTEFAAFDFQQLAVTYESHCPEDEKNILENYEEFREYIRQWEDVFQEAAENHWGIMFHLG